MIHKTKIKVRWSDLDPNHHLANTQFLNFTSAARMEALESCGLTLNNLYKFHRGPVILEEKINYFKEVMAGSTVVVHTIIDGVSENGVLFSFKQDLYSTEGKHHAHAQLFGCWLDMQTRKIAKDLPKEMYDKIKNLVVEDAKKLTALDIKNIANKPKDLRKDEL